MAQTALRLVEQNTMNRDKALETALSQIERAFGKGSIMKLGKSDQNADVEVIPTGSLGLDIALGIGGLPRGRVVEIYGPESSGKTTLAKLLCRLADPSSGTIAVGGVDLRDVSADARRRSIRMVPQDGFLFDTTVRENVRFGRPDATDANVDAAFERLGLGWWPERLADGLETAVGERGERLSVGERQLVALARA